MICAAAGRLHSSNSCLTCTAASSRCGLAIHLPKADHCPGKAAWVVCNECLLCQHCTQSIPTVSVQIKLQLCAAQTHFFWDMRMRCRHVVLAALHVKVQYYNPNLQLCVTHVVQTFADDLHKHNLQKKARSCKSPHLTCSPLDILSQQSYVKGLSTARF